MANQHVVYRQHNKWTVRKENADRDTKVVGNQEKAFKIARKAAINQGGEAFIHGRDGKIRERNTYKDDPYPPAG